MTDAPMIERALVQADLTIRSGGDGRTVYGLAVPFDRVETVDDGYGPYEEVFRKGAFAQTINVGVERVKLLKQHRRQADPIGRATMLREDDAGLVGEFYVSKTQEGNDTLELIRDGALDAFSVGFAGVKDRKIGRNMVERLEVRLREVSVVTFGAYVGALVAGVRSQIEDFSDEELEALRSIARDLGTRPVEAVLSGTSEAEQSIHPEEQAVGHSPGTPNHDGLRFELTEYVSRLESLKEDQ